MSPKQKEDDAGCANPYPHLKWWEEERRAEPILLGRCGQGRRRRNMIGATPRKMQSSKRRDARPISTNKSWTCAHKPNRVAAGAAGPGRNGPALGRGIGSTRGAGLELGAGSCDGPLTWPAARLSQSASARAARGASRNSCSMALNALTATSMGCSMVGAKVGCKGRAHTGRRDPMRKRKPGRQA